MIALPFLAVSALQDGACKDRADCSNLYIDLCTNYREYALVYCPLYCNLCG